MIFQRHWPLRAAIIFFAGLVLIPLGLYCFIVWKLYTLAAVAI